MAFIVEQIASNRGIQLGYEAVVRPFAFGTNWTKIRVGMLYAINGYSTMPAATVLHLGVATGNCSSLSASATDAFWMPSSNLSGQLNYAGTAPNVYYTNGTAQNVNYQRVGSTTTAASAPITASNASCSANPSALKSAMFFDITKGTVGAAAVTSGWIYMNATQVVNDISDSTFLAQLENETAAVTANLTYVSGVSTALPIRFTKDWDSMFVAWTHATPTACIYRMSVCRFS